ncbi:uncharacterized protein LOC124357265 [Homalodisca vitripennis]|uniref:uncharacterized protein LOC124357265 n=1 Tax=Homalodisca vitripennis TaxID=197043 RepID=UPI001EEC28A2|nr:uncharacterized protein LOC124357265 [Homalodisca vitripennis]
MNNACFIYRLMMGYFFLVILILGGVPSLKGSPGLFARIREWLETRRACRCDCPVYFDTVCGFDHDNGYVLADNMCLMLRHNQCHKTNYVIVDDSICEDLLNFTQHFVPPLLIRVTKIIL